MTAGPSIDPELFLHDQLAQASPDLMREMLKTFINALLSAEADAVCGAEYGARSVERTNRCNGYRHRDLDTRVETRDVAISKLRESSYFRTGYCTAPAALSGSQATISRTITTLPKNIRHCPSASNPVVVGLSTRG